MVKTEKSAHISYNDETWHPSSKSPKMMQLGTEDLKNI